MTKVQKAYQAIDCGYHDYMEHYATIKKPIEILYYNETGAISKLENTVIENLSGGKNGEYIHVKIDAIETLIRMDYLISVDGIKAADQKGSNCSTAK